MKNLRNLLKMEAKLIIILLCFCTISFAQKTDYPPQKLGPRSSIETIFPIDRNCIVVFGKLYDFGSNFALKDCGNTHKIISLDLFGSFDNPQTQGENRWAIVSGSLVKINVNEKSLSLKVVKRKTNDLFLNDVSFIDDERGWVCGDDGKVLFTNDGGEMWSEQNSTTNIDLRQIGFANSNFGWMIGKENNNGDFLSIFLITMNGGETWKRIELPTGESFISASFMGKKVCGLTSFTSVFCYNANKENWQSYTIVNNNTSGIYFVNEKIGFIIGDKILKTNNGGKTWVDKLNTGNLERIYFLDDKIGFVWNLNTVYKTINSGETWQKISEKWFE